MVIHNLTTFLLFLLFFHLATFGLALVVAAGYGLVRMSYPPVHRFCRDHLFGRRADPRVTEIRAIGAQARSEMEQLYYEYVYWLARQKHPQGDSE